MTQPVRHIHDREHRHNGSEGEWTVCGKPWTGGPETDWPDVPLCTVCAEDWKPLQR